MPKEMRFTCRLDVVSFSVLLMMQREAGGSRADVLRRLIKKGELAPTGSVAALTRSASFRLTSLERAELNVMARHHGLEPAELVRRMLRANAQR